MTGYWYISAIAMTATMFSVIWHQPWMLLVILIWLIWLYYQKRLKPLVMVTTIIVCLITVLHPPLIQSANDPTEMTSQSPIKGTINSPINQTNDKTEFIMRTDSNTLMTVVHFHNDLTSENLKLSETLHHGGVCEITGVELERPSAGTNPGEFDYRHYLATQQIQYQVILDSLAQISCSGQSQLDHIYQLRNKLQSHVEASLDTVSAGWLKGLVFGDTTGIDSEEIELFRRWSLSHLLAISGLHVGLVMALVYMILVKGNVLTKSKAQWILLLFLPFYALLAGGEPSVWRASLMAMILIIMTKLEKKVSVTDGLSIVFIAIVLIDPFIVYHIGFQLSFLVTFGLLLSGKWLVQTVNSPLFSLLRISFMSQIMILPLQIFYFHLFNPLSIVLNVLMVPYFTLFVIPFMFVLLVSTMFSILPTVLGNLFVTVHQQVMNFMEWIDEVAYFPMVMREMPLWTMGLYYGLLIWLMIGLQQGKNVEAFKRSIGLVSVLIVTMLQPYFSPIGTVTMLDIGQGDALVIELPYRKGVIFIDAGAEVSYWDEADEKTYKQIIEPFLLSRGISKVDAIFLSHADQDHIGSADAIIKDFNVDTLFLSRYYQPDSRSQQLWEDFGVETRRLKSPSRLKIGNQMFSIFSPNQDFGKPNENSLIIHTMLGGKGWLFMGDASQEVERHITKYLSDTAVDVLKVGHHGSKTSTGPDFVNQIEPSYGLISAGRSNQYGHPAKQVLETLKNAGVQILRTDQSGAILFQFIQEDGAFYKFNSDIY